MNLSKIEIALFAAVMVINFIAIVHSVIVGDLIGKGFDNLAVMMWCGLYYWKVHEYNNLRDSIKKGMWWSK